MKNPKGCCRPSVDKSQTDSVNYLHKTWVWAKRRTSYRCLAKNNYLFPYFVIFIHDFKLTSLVINFCTE